MNNTKQLANFLTNNLNLLSKEAMLTADDLDLLKSEMEALMTKEQIRKKYKIQQMNANNPEAKDHRFWVRIPSLTIPGKKVKCSATTEDELIEKILAREKEVVNLSDDVQINRDITLMDFAEKHFLPKRFLETASGTYSIDYATVHNFLEHSAIAKKEMAKVTFKDAQNFFTFCKEWKHNPANKTMFADTNFRKKYWDNIRNTMRLMYAFAISLGVCNVNPFATLLISQNNFDENKITTDYERAFTHAEIQELRKLCIADVEAKNDAIPYAIVLITHTGAREGEITALRWRDLKNKPGYLWIHSELIVIKDEKGKRKGYQYVDHAKSPAGTRHIKIHPHVQAIFDEIRKLNIQNGFSCDDDDYIFQRRFNGEVTFCTPRSFASRLEDLCDKMGIVRKSLHDIRRYFATRLFYGDDMPAPIPLEEIKSLMGHSNIKQTEDYIVKREIIEHEDLLSYT